MLVCEYCVTEIHPEWQQFYVETADGYFHDDCFDELVLNEGITNEQPFPQRNSTY